MGIGGKQSKEAVVVAVEAPVAEPSHSKKNKKMSSLQKMTGLGCYGVCLKTQYVMLGVLAVILSFAMITITVLTSIATKTYDTDQSSRLVAMVLLAVTSAIAACIVIYAQIAVFKKNIKPIHTATIVLLVLAVIQALVAGICVNMTQSDEDRLVESLQESFNLAREGNLRHKKLWATTQYDLNCCGVSGPQDYSIASSPNYFPPNIPISCCPSYDPTRPDAVQERNREICRAKKTYYDIGCKNLVLDVFRVTSSMVLGVTVTLIIVELLLVITGAILCKRTKRKQPVSAK